MVELQLIPAENMVAAFQASSTPVFATANSASEARDAFEVLYQTLVPHESENRESETRSATGTPPRLSLAPGGTSR